MLISIDWIKDFVKLPDLSSQELGSRFTLATAEVEDIQCIGECFEKIRVAQVLEIEKHPQADKLNLVTFDLGDGEKGKVVCGASNVKVGMKTPYAPVGTTLPNGLTLEPKKIRGIESTGMLCSEQELGYAESSSGILELKGDAPVGTTLKEYFDESSDIIFDIDNKSLTHRPDLWGHYGIAREFAAIFEKELANPFNNKWFSKLEKLQNSEKAPVKVVVEKECAGMAYFGLSVDGVEVTESPKWLKRRLTNVGLRPINNIVDISNYVMMELGMPLHIFDRDLISGDTLTIKKVGAAQKFVTLDEIERDLIASDTVINDSDKPLVIAGIMGGLNSGVNDKTSKIFIEVANWKPHMVRQTSTRLGLRTDSSQRYEKSLDSKMCMRTMMRTLELVLQLCSKAKVVGKIQYDGDDLSKIPALSISSRVSKIESVLGKEIGAEKIVSILEALDFGVERKSDQLKISVPSYRATKDVEYEADIIEEIGRIIGYDNIVPQSLGFAVSPVHLSRAQKMQRKTRDYLVLRAGCFEIMTYPMVGKNLLKKASWDENEPLVLLNALSKESDRMRPSLVPSILEACALNAKHNNNFKLFELGRVYKEDSKNFSQDLNQLIIAYYDKESNQFMNLLNQVEKYLSYMGLSYNLSEANDRFENSLISHKWLGAHPYEYISIRIMGKVAGVITSVHPTLNKNYKIKGNLSLAVIDLSQFEKVKLKDKRKFQHLAKFPNSEFDCTVVVDNSIPSAKVLEALSKVKIEELKGVKIKEIYPLNSMQKSITIKSFFNDKEKTLSPERLKYAEDAIVKTLMDKGFPLKGQ